MILFTNKSGAFVAISHLAMAQVADLLFIAGYRRRLINRSGKFLLGRIK